MFSKPFYVIFLLVNTVHYYLRFSIHIGALLRHDHSPYDSEPVLTYLVILPVVKSKLKHDNTVILYSIFHAFSIQTELILKHFTCKVSVRRFSFPADVLIEKSARIATPNVVSHWPFCFFPTLSPNWVTICSNENVAFITQSQCVLIFFLLASGGMAFCGRWVNVLFYDVKEDFKEMWLLNSCNVVSDIDVYLYYISFFQEARWLRHKWRMLLLNQLLLKWGFSWQESANLSHVFVIKIS